VPQTHTHTHAAGCGCVRCARSAVQADLLTHCVAHDVRLCLLPRTPTLWPCRPQPPSARTHTHIHTHIHTHTCTHSHSHTHTCVCPSPPSKPTGTHARHTPRALT
jgi:hypothetical protein